MTALTLASTSRAEDAGYLALADVARVAGRLNADYRLIGGLSVSLLAATYRITDVPIRETADADLGARYEVVGNELLVGLLSELGYRRPGASNRFVRTLADETQAVIDVLAPSFTGRHRPNQQHGRLVVDEIPGLHYALAVDPVVVEIEARLTTGERVSATVTLPSPHAALILKLLSWQSRLAAKDAVDIWRTLAVAHAAGVGPTDWRGSGVHRDAAAVLAQFTAINGLGLRQISSNRSTQTRVRALAGAVGPRTR